MEEPITPGKSVTMTITISGKSDFSNLGVSLFHEVDAVRVEEPKNPEKKIKKTVVLKSGLDWIVDVEANQPLTIERKLHFPKKEGLFQLVASASTQEGVRVTDALYIHITADQADVYYSGTPIPITQGPEPASSPGPIPTSFFEPEPTLVTPEPSYP